MNSDIDEFDNTPESRHMIAAAGLANLAQEHIIDWKEQAEHEKRLRFTAEAVNYSLRAELEQLRRQAIIIPPQVVLPVSYERGNGRASDYEDMDVERVNEMQGEMNTLRVERDMMRAELGMAEAYIERLLKERDARGEGYIIRRPTFSPTSAKLAAVTDRNLSLEDIPMGSKSPKPTPPQHPTNATSGTLSFVANPQSPLQTLETLRASSGSGAINMKRKRVTQTDSQVEHCDESESQGRYE
jgi:hypothetical protein